MGNGLMVAPASSAVIYAPVMNMSQVLDRYNQIQELIKKHILIEGQDYGAIPGTQMPTLLQPGAQKLACFFGLSPTFELVSKEEREGAEPMLAVHYRCHLSRDGITVGQGDGYCSTRERKYRYRWLAETELPPGASTEGRRRRGGIRKLFEFDWAIKKRETGGRYGKPEAYWDLFDAAIQAGSAKRTERDMKGKMQPGWEITAEEWQFEMPNPDIYDQFNTVIKMSMKRALVAAVLLATGASAMFTQDVEDMPDLSGGSYEAQAAVAAQKIDRLRNEQQQQQEQQEQQQEQPKPEAKNQADPPQGDGRYRGWDMPQYQSKDSVASWRNDVHASLAEQFGKNGADAVFLTALKAADVGSLADLKRVGQIRTFCLAVVDAAIAKAEAANG